MNRPLGTPTWLDFGSNDFAASKTFYEKFFGWEFETSGEEYGGYNMIRKDGALVAGAMDTSQMTCPDGGPIPSSWDIYLEVDDVDARVALAEQNGAQVIVPAGDAGGAGRFAMVLDPTQASVGLWKGADTAGYEFSGDPGTPVWFELLTQDFDRSLEFYKAVFDFKPTPMTTEMVNRAEELGMAPDDASGYVTNGPESEASSGICDVLGVVPAEDGSFWRVYFCVEDCDAAAKKAAELGGKLLDGPIDSPYGRVATIADPAGATFQISAPSQKAAEGQQA